MPPRCRRSRYSEMATEEIWIEGEVGRVKCVLVGDGAIGKTSLIFNYTTNFYPTEYIPTAYDHYTVLVTVNEKPIRLQICDTAGQDDFDSLRPFAYKDPATDVYLLCFSVVIPSSFENVTLKWLPEIRKYSPTAPVILVGTQSDLRQDAQTLIELSRYGEKPVSEIAAHRLANEIKAELYIESSALTQKNLKKVFDEAILSGIKHNKELASLTIGRSRGKKLSRSRSKGREQPKEAVYREKRKKKPLWQRIFCFFR